MTLLTQPSGTVSPLLDASRARVLMVDDHRANLLALQVVLDDLELELIEAQSGEEALARVAQDDFAVVLLDVNMPGMNGFETAQKIRANEATARVPIIFLTANDIDPESLAEGYRLGAVDFLGKPLLAAALRSKVRGMAELYLDRQRARHEAEQLRLLVDTAQDYAMFLLDAEGYVITWNPGAERIKQYHESEILGQHFGRFYTQEAIDRAWPAYELKVARQVGRFEDEGWRVRKDGSLFWANVIITALRDESGQVRGFSKITRDITVRKEAEENARRLIEELTARRIAEENARVIQEQQAQLREQTTIAETLNRIGGVLAGNLDLHSLVQTVTDEGTKLTGAQFGAFLYNVIDEQNQSYTPYTLSGVPIEAFSQFPMPRNTDLFGATFRGEGIVRLDDVTADPRYGKNAPHHGMPAGRLPITSYLAVPVVSRGGEVLGGLFFGHEAPAAFTDRHERIIAGIAGQAAVAIDNARLYQSKHATAERLNLALSSANLGDWTWDTRTDMVTLSERAAAIFGIPAGRHMTWAKLQELLHAEDLDRVLLEVARALRERLQYDVEYRVQRPDGSQVWVAAAGLARYDAEGAPLGMFGLLEDITERKRLEESLRLADQRKDEFLATLAHELRNPLAPIRNGLQILRLAGRDEQTREETQAMMDRQLTQMVRLVDDLLDVSRITRNKLDLRMQDVDLATVVQAAVETSRPLIAERRHELTIGLPASPLHVNADPTRLAQVLSNLLNNSAKYSDPGGRIWLTVEREEGEAVIRVRDRGIGIPTDQLQSIFELFTQLARHQSHAQGGLGIGLMLVKRLIEMHGGSIEAESDGPGAGSTFTIRVAALPALQPTPSIEKPTPAPRAPGRRILVVDDNQDAAISLGMILKMLGHQTRIVHDGLQAVEAAGEFLPEVICLDIGLPGMDGYATCRRIREQPGGAQMLIVALTGWGQDEDRRRSAEAGFNHHLVKPVNPTDLQRLITQTS